ncbi:MAG: AmmeMemoRadiSam system radical SAM enzyme [Candidatus Falkowbacteria bacterium]|nr:AmmeMemoRadiSam system radical SAM enzyme [Candidatus Falkowbacteria bacterium]
MEKASLYKQLNDSTIQCELCNHFCVIKDGRVGICRVRKNKKGSLYSLVYGQPVAMNVDPVEKKPLFHFQPGSLTYSLGTYGCNFACANCQNWDISQETNIEKKLANLPFVAPEEIINETIANDCQSISYTYNEPTVFTEYALKIMKLAHQQKLKNIWVSNGYMSKQCLEKIIPFLNAINIDLKSFTEKFYQENCHARLQPILNSLQFLQEQQVHLEITTLIIPTLSMATK